MLTESWNATGGAKAIGAAVTLYALLQGNTYSANHLNPIVTFGCVSRSSS